MTEEGRDERLMLVTSTLSHELRTPINTIKGYIEVCLRSDELPEDLRPHLEKAVAKSLELNSLLKDLLDLSTIMGSRKLPIYPRWFKMSWLADSIQKDARQFSERFEGVDFRFDIPDPVLGLRIRTDHERLKQALLNIIENALKYTIRGSVLVKVRVSKERLFFFVEDTGIGISRDDIDRIFEPFYQVDAGKARKFGGAGLGLPLCREIIERLDGKLMVNSELGKGSKFIIDIPICSDSLGMVDNLLLEIEG